jgi:hypothetical protein
MLFKISLKKSPIIKTPRIVDDIPFGISDKTNQRFVNIVMYIPNLLVMSSAILDYVRTTRTGYRQHA